MAFSRQIRFLICLLATFPLAVSSSAVNAEDKEAGEAAERLFVRRVWPLLNEKCLACHGDDVETREGGWIFRSEQACFKAAIVASPR